MGCLCGLVYHDFRRIRERLLDGQLREKELAVLEGEGGIVLESSSELVPITARRVASVSIVP